MNAVAIVDQIILKVTRALSNVQIRDRFLKVLQYSIRFIISYYSRYSSKAAIQKLEDCFMIVSNSRKFFRLFNSIGSIKQVADIIRNISPASDTVGTSLQIATQVFWGFFFFFDNIILYNRMLPPPNRNYSIERWFFSSWVGAELCRMAQIIRTLVKTMARQKQLESYLARDMNAPLDNNGKTLQDPASRLQQLNFRIKELQYNLAKSIAGVFVATNVHPDLKLLYNRFLSDRQIVVKDFFVMVSAVTTSVLDIYENIN